MYTRARPAGVRSSGNFISTRYAVVGVAGTFTFDANAPGSVCAAIANTSSRVYGVASRSGVDCGGGGSGAAFKVRTIGSVVRSNAISTPVAVIATSTIDE